MASIKGVMLLPLDASSYRRHVAHHTSLAKANSGTKIADPRQDLTGMVEDCVRQEMQIHYSKTDFRVLRWEQLDARNRYVVKFRELDGVFETRNGTTILLEVKASASKNSLRTGLEQLHASVRTATRAKERHIGAQTQWHAPEEHFYFEAAFVDELEQLAQEGSHAPGPELALIAQGDEVLDWREMRDRYPRAQQIILPGNDHAISDFALHLEGVLGFLDLV